MSHEQPSGASPTANAASNTTPAPPTLSNGQTSKTPKKAKSQSSTTTNLAPLKPASVLPNMPSLPTGFSASTEEILRRVSANAAAHAGTPGYEAAREQVLKNYVTSASMTSSQPTPKSKRAGKGASKVVGMPSSMRAESATRVVDGSATPASAASTASAKAKGVGRGKGRGAGKGGKRKRAESSESEDDSDISSSYIPLPTKTKSGRNVTKPTQFTPVIPTPSTAPRKKRVVTKQPRETSVCKICQRGHSPSCNMIVFCDGCNSGYHQYCHQPPIEKEVVQVAEKEWFCGKCADTRRNNAISDAIQLVAGPELTREEKKAYLNALPASKLGELLLHAIDLHPNLPIFPPNARTLISAIKSIPNSTPSSHTLDTTTAAIMSANKASFSANSLLQTTSTSLTSSNNAALPVQPPETASSDPYKSTIPETKLEDMVAASPADLGDPYNDGYDTDPPAHYPKPGQGLARTLRPESEDLQWLEDDNMDVFSHMYGGDQSLLNGFGADGAMV
ncbi:hypothetical protein HDK77DRAFT_217825 [Phyllosticta capitalensis]